MCRPIESGEIGASAASSALFPGVAMTNMKQLMGQSGLPSAARLGGGASSSVLPPWAMGERFADDPFRSATASPRMAQLPFVNLPWANTPPSSTANGGMTAQDFALFGLPDAKELETQSQPTAASVQEAMEAAELEELLDFTMPDELLDLENKLPLTTSTDNQQQQQQAGKTDDGFDGTEMSILFSFLVDAPEDKELHKPLVLDTSNDGILNLNMLTNSPLEALMESLDDGFSSDEFRHGPTMADPAFYKTQPSHGDAGEMKSRRLCRNEGCNKRSRSNGLCISHGGGRRCEIEGCEKSSQGGNLCIRHGGGKRCSHENCDKAAQSNFLCKAHGGGPRCQIDGCNRSSQGGGYCRSHGGGKRCLFDGCEKGTQRGDYCALHGGSRLCEVPGCMRNDRGGGLCATHGGGKRCNTDGCEKPCRRRGLCSAHLRQMEGK